MNIDERIEALTQSVELLSQMHQDNEKLYAKLFKQADERFGKNDERFSKMVDAIDGLVRIAEVHENRIKRLEGHDQN